MQPLALLISIFLPYLAAKRQDLSLNPSCKSLSDCPGGYSNCTAVHGVSGSRCIETKSRLCVGGVSDYPIRSCNRARDCTGNSTNYKGWCDYETKFCCAPPPNSNDLMTCPDRLTPMYGQEKCKGGKKGFIYSGVSEQKGGLCYKNYSCPPKITRVHDLAFGRMSFRTNMDCSVDVQVDTKYNYMFCHKETGNLWVIGQLNVNGDEVEKHWTQCKLNSDCGDGQVCVKEDLCRYRCYEDPTMEIDYKSIVFQLMIMFLLPLIFLASVIFLTVRYLD